MRRMLLGMAALTITATGCRNAPSDKARDAAAAPAAGSPTTVSTVPVVSRKLATTITLPAQLTAYEQVDIYPKVTGFVESITVDRGSHVRRGELLVLLTAPELNSQR